MRRIRCIVVGKLKAPHFRDAVEFYTMRVSRYYPLEIVVLKDAPKALDPAGKASHEGMAILGKLASQDRPICLDERGKTLNSRQFAATMGQWIEDPGSQPCFIIGGAFGLSNAVHGSCTMSLALGPMTMSHELARVVLLEQLYRATAILHGHPYHHD
jgi:23S rRNA (pseudouridine1915-N3)-methyltransferase